MRFQRCINSDCSRPFQVNEFSAHAADARGHITWPHCGHTTAASSASVFLVHAMTPEEEAKFNLDNPHSTA